MRRFKPMKIDKIVISIRINKEKLENIDRIAHLNDISRNDLINQCLDYALENVDIKKECKC